MEKNNHIEVDEKRIRLAGNAWQTLYLPTLEKAVQSLTDEEEYFLRYPEDNLDSSDLIKFGSIQKITEGLATSTP